MAAGAVRAKPREIEPPTAQTAVLRSWARIQNFHPETAKYRGRGRGLAVRPRQTALYLKKMMKKIIYQVLIPDFIPYSKKIIYFFLFSELLDFDLMNQIIKYG